MNKFRSVGDVLRLKREALTYSLDDVAEATKIKKSYLIAIERGNWQILPAPTFTKGLIRNYAKYVGLSGDEVVAIFRREFDEARSPIKQTKLLQPSKVHFTPSTLLKIVIILLIVGFVSYFVHEYQTLTGPPKLTLISPKDNLVIENNLVVVAGSSSPEALVKVNDQAIMVDNNGSFQVSLDIVDTTTITVVAVAKSGKTSTVSRTVIRKPSAP